MKELLSCPFCNCGCAKIEKELRSYLRFFVRCAQCKARTRATSNEGAAVALWNKRTKAKP